MLMAKAGRPTTRTLGGWAISVLLETGAVRECQEHGWMQDRADPHARERAFDMVGRASLRRRLRSRKFWTASATPAPNVRLWTEPDMNTPGPV